MAAEQPDEPPGGVEPPAWLREAATADLDRLLEIEQRCFPGDRLSRRAFRHLLTRANAIHLVAGVGRTAVGYVSVLLRAGSRGARIYSLAVDPRWQGRRIGKQLLEGAEARASAAGCESSSMRWIGTSARTRTSSGTVISGWRSRRHR